MSLIDHDALTELSRSLIATSIQLYPERSVDDHLDRAAAAVSALTDCPDPWLALALERAAEQLRLEVP